MVLFRDIFGLLAATSACLAALPPPSSDPWPLQSFKTTPYHPPFLNVTKAGQTESGYLFLAPIDYIRGSDALTIYSDDGQLIWYGPSPGGPDILFSNRPQYLHGEPVITYWSGEFAPQGFGYGTITILNSSYQEIGKVTLPSTEENRFRAALPGNHSPFIDLHEDTITAEGTMLVTAVNVTQMDLSSEGPKLDINTNELLFRWSTVEHIKDIPLSDSMAPLQGSGYNASKPYEYPHLNGVSKYGDTYLVSSQYLCSIYLIHKNGTILWKLHGQRGGDFELGLGTQFCYQHTPRLTSGLSDRVTVHMHNNDNTEFTDNTIQTTGLILDLDLKTMRTSLNTKMWDPVDPIYSESQGSYQNLTNGHVLLGHGVSPKIEEYDENGACVMRTRFGYDGTMQSYRVFRSAWTGTPKTKPDVVACSTGIVYVSWNGATDVQSWRIYTGSDKDDIRVVSTIPKNGFETRAMVGDLSGKVIVEALGGPNGGVRSDMVPVSVSC